MSFIENDEELVFSKKDRNKRKKAIKSIYYRDKFFIEKSLGYSEALQRVESISRLLEAFFGYLKGLEIEKETFYEHIYILLNSKQVVLEKNIEYILYYKIKDFSKILEALAFRVV